MHFYRPKSLLVSGSLTLVTVFGLAACGGGSDVSSTAAPAASIYAPDPPPRVSASLSGVSIPEVIVPQVATAAPVVKSGAVILAETDTTANSGLKPISTVDPIAALGGRSVANAFKPADRKDLKLVAGMEDRALPTGKWYKGFFYQSPLNLAAEFPVANIGEQSVYAFPNRLALDDRIGMVSIAFPRKFYVDQGEENAIARLGNFTNRYIQDDYLFSILRDGRTDAYLTYVSPATGRLTRRIDQQDELSVTTSWNNAATPQASSQSMQLIAANGSPYVTVKYKNLRPIVAIGQSINSQRPKNDQNLPIDVGNPLKWEADANIKSVAADNEAPTAFQETGESKLTRDLTGKKFRFVYAMADRGRGKTEPYSQRVMVVYASQSLTLSWDAASRAYTAKNPFTGVLRVAYVDEQAEAGAPAGTVVAYAARERVLDQYATEYPISSGVNLDYDGKVNSTVKYSWRTETTDGSAATGSKLLMMAFDATHLKSMANPTKAGLNYPSNFGNMTGVVGPSWTQTLQVPSILHDSKDSKQKELWMGTGAIKAADRSAVVASLKKDAAGAQDAIAHCNYESYLCGKQIGNIARLVLIADQVGETATRDQMLGFLKTNLNPWFDGKDDNDPAYQDKIKQGIRDYFLYDTVNRGVVTLRPFTKNNIAEDFYNASYVDHMFHYGYFIYGAAVLARFDPVWREAYKEPVNTLVRDIANASGADKSFPITRTYDWFRMQNLADAGPTDKGGNTESSSESINSGYAAVLWGSVTGNGELQALAAIMVAGEIRTAQAFYQITPENNVFPDVAAVTVPVVGGKGGRTSSLTLDPAKIDALGIKYQGVSQHQVFFGPQRMFRIGIQLLPITPISEFVISPTWAKTHQASLLELEQDQTALYEDLFKIAPQDALCSKDINMVTDKVNPGGVCAGYARTLYSWRQVIASGNGVNDPEGTYNRYLGYVNKVDQQTADFARLSVGSPFQRPGDPAKGEPAIVTDKFGAAGISVDILKDISTPSNNTTVLWWLSSRKK